jgi:hypothetical protein
VKIVGSQASLKRQTVSDYVNYSFLIPGKMKGPPGKGLEIGPKWG